MNWKVAPSLPVAVAVNTTDVAFTGATLPAQPAAGQFEMRFELVTWKLIIVANGFAPVGATVKSTRFNCGTFAGLIAEVPGALALPAASYARTAIVAGKPAAALFCGALPAVVVAMLRMKNGTVTENEDDVVSVLSNATPSAG